MTSEPELSLFQKVLLATDGTVTELIALYAGEPIRVTKLSQAVEVAGARNDLECAEPTPLLHRRILLSGATKNYLYAESQFVLERLSATIRQQMLETDRPIGLLWKEERLETFREIVRQTIGPCPAVSPYFDLPPAAPFVSRTYRVHHAGKPLGVISEKWPVSHFR